MTTAATISERNTPSHQRLSVLTTHHPLCGTTTGRGRQALSHGESGAKSGSYLDEAGMQVAEPRQPWCPGWAHACSTVAAEETAPG